MNSSPKSSRQRLANIPPHLRINIIYSDEDIIAIHKPSLLRSVPGNRRKGGEQHSDVAEGLVNSSSSAAAVQFNVKNGSAKRKRGDSESAVGGGSAKCDDIEDDIPARSASQLVQQAWIDAITYYRDSQDDTIEKIIHSTEGLINVENMEDTQKQELKSDVKSILRNLASKSDGRLASIPRKYKTFNKYCQRNVKVILPHYVVDKPSKNGADNETGGPNTNRITIKKLLDATSRVTFEILRLKARSFNLLDAKRTKEEDSALGQLQLLSQLITQETLALEDSKILEEFGSSSFMSVPHRDPIYVVHRLDCETSGVMVFARNEHAAGELSRAWRERNSVTKVYLAKVKSWPPFHNHGHRNGEINLPLAAMENERLKWHLKEEKYGGKPSKTLWKVYNDEDQTLTGEGSVLLELMPVTGRTHQLRVHCAAIGSGIEGDSLYGDDPVELLDAEKSHGFSDSSLSLKLHAYRLSIPHPSKKENVSFQCNCRWITT